MAKQNDEAGAQTAGIQGSGLAGSTTVAGATDVVSRKVTIGRTVHVTDPTTKLIHPAIVTHVNPDQNIVATVFKPNETIVGHGFEPAVGNLAASGCWHWPT